MTPLIDTNIAILLRDSDPAAIAVFVRLNDTPAISVFSLIELEGGVYARPDLTARRRQRLDAMLAEMTIVPFDLRVIRAYGEIVARCGFSRRRIIDRLIAAAAIVADRTLMTANPADFRDIPGLRLEVWPNTQ